ncbi:hypothetical protein [Nonomuraea aridisoli]|uniref:hypothetical protein n=1 Tax=Nonomuraea aridisoli TaxID=2070368 RepID=UPI001F191EA3|nr:hypothetical protein [Nonomuraea aridisoli]
MDDGTSGTDPCDVRDDLSHGCYIVGEVEPVMNFDASTNGRFVQARDKQIGELVW